MTNARRVWWAIGVGSLALAITVALFLATNLSRIAKAAIQKIGPEVLGVAVTVDSVSLSPLSGKGEIRGLTIANPPSYRAPYLLRLRSLSFSVALGSLGKNPIQIQEISIQDPSLNWEGDFSQSNIGRVQKNVARFSENGKSASGSDRRFVIGHFRMEGAKAGVRFANAASFTVPLPPIELHDLGAGGQGSSIKEVVAVILSEIGTAVGKVLQQSPQAVGGALDTLGKAVGGGLKGLLGK